LINYTYYIYTLSHISFQNGLDLDVTDRYVDISFVLFHYVRIVSLDYRDTAFGMIVAVYEIRNTIIEPSHVTYMAKSYLYSELPSHITSAI